MGTVMTILAAVTCFIYFFRNRYTTLEAQKTVWQDGGDRVLVWTAVSMAIRERTKAVTVWQFFPRKTDRKRIENTPPKMQPTVSLILYHSKRSSCSDSRLFLQ